MFFEKSMQKNTFVHRIDKEEIDKMPIVRFEGEVIVVNRHYMLKSAMAYLNGQPTVGVDTEARPSFHRGEHFPTSLLQISSRERCYLFQLSQLGFPQELADLFSNEKVKKVGLAFKDDLAGLQRLRKFTPRNCIDVQKMVNDYGIMDLGLQKIFAIIFGKKISKSQQLTNWANVFLSVEQARYASTDAWATLLIYEQLLQTEPLDEKEVIRLKTIELEKQKEHQQQVLEKKQHSEIKQL